jgi:hypothetical protein
MCAINVCMGDHHQSGGEPGEPLLSCYPTEADRHMSLGKNTGNNVTRTIIETSTTMETYKVRDSPIRVTPL